MKTSIRVDAYSSASSSWETVLHAYSRQPQSGIYLLGAEGVKESPTFTRNAAKPLFGDGVVESKIAYAEPRLISLDILGQFQTVAAANSFIDAISNLPNTQRTGYMRLFRIEYNDNNIPTFNYKIDVRCADSFIEKIDQKGTSVLMDLNFYAPNPIFTRQTGPVV